jgi:DNA-directed RNA polymerase specialized sigma24 family protein
MSEHVRDDDFDTFFRRRSPALLKAAYLLTGDRGLAEDLVQEALARSYRVWPRLVAQGNPESYTRRVMYNLQVSRWRPRRFAEVQTDRVPDRGLARMRPVTLWTGWPCGGRWARYRCVSARP